MLKSDLWSNSYTKFLLLYFRSNCVDHVQTKLRKHYERPRFLPDDSESSSLDWIFMGGSGTGAMMHVSRRLFSWEI